MLKKRIIPCLDIKDGRTVKGINFDAIRDAGDPVELAKRYVIEGADELVFLDITATTEKRKTLAALVKKIAAEINIPFTVGGGISSLEDVDTIIQAGADKVSINTAACKNPELITQIAKVYGSQCVVVAIDAGYEKNDWHVFTHGGKTATGIPTITWARQAAAMGAGEILLTAINKDGTKNGFALDITSAVSDAVSIPVIASGGAGKMEHFREVFQNTAASGALAASIFHFREISVPQLKNYLRSEKIAIR